MGVVSDDTRCTVAKAESIDLVAKIGWQCGCGFSGDTKCSVAKRGVARTDSTDRLIAMVEMVGVARCA